MVVGFIRRRWVHLGAPFGLSRSFGVVGLVRVRPGGRGVHFRVVGYVFVRPAGSRGHSGWLGTFRYALCIVGRWVQSGTLAVVP